MLASWQYDVHKLSARVMAQPGQRPEWWQNRHVPAAVPPDRQMRRSASSSRLQPRGGRASLQRSKTGIRLNQVGIVFTSGFYMQFATSESDAALAQI